MYYRFDALVDITRDLTIGDGDAAVTYPAASLQNAELREELSIVWEEPIAPADDRFYFDGDVTRPRPPEMVRPIVLAAVNAACDGAISSVKVGYPPTEVESWPKQESEARAYVKSNSAPTPMLDALCAAREITKADLVARIIAKADAFAVIVGGYVGKRQKLEGLIDEAADLDTLLAIIW